MTFESFPLARDLGYGSALFLGISLGLLLYIPWAGDDSRRKSRFVSLFFILLSVTVALLAVALVYSTATLLWDREYYVPWVLVCVFSVAGSRFPRVVGFPLIVLLGVSISWISYTYLRSEALLPGNNPVGILRVDGQNQISVRFDSFPPELIPIRDQPYLPLEFQNENGPLLCSVTVVRFHRLAPLIGGTSRILRVFITQETRLVASKPKEWGNPPVWAPVLALERRDLELPLDRLTPGTRWGIRFEADRLNVSLMK
jgi:hypothetical protein